MVRIEHYADALVAMVARGTTPAHAVKSLAAHLESRGRARVLNRLKTQLTHRGIADERRDRSVIEVAHDKDVANARQATSHCVSQTSAVRRDATLIGGWRLITHNTLIDNSFKKHLLDIYKCINISL